MNRADKLQELAALMGIVNQMSPMGQASGMMQMMSQMGQDQQRGRLTEAQIKQMEHQQQQEKLRTHYQSELGKLEVMKAKAGLHFQQKEDARAEKMLKQAESEFGQKQRQFTEELRKIKAEATQAETMQRTMTPEMAGLVAFAQLLGPYTERPTQFVEAAMKLQGLLGQEESYNPKSYSGLNLGNDGGQQQWTQAQIDAINKTAAGGGF